jgi:hypothetical protein
MARLRFIGSALVVCAALAASQTPRDRLGDLRPRLPPGFGATYGLVLADFDGDGRLEALRHSNSHVEVLTQGPDGRFTLLHPPLDVLAVVGGQANGIAGVAVGRIDGDPFPDVVVGVGATAPPGFVFRNDGTGRLSLVAPGPFAALMYGASSHFLIADVDGQNGNDLVCIERSSPTRLFLATRAGGFNDASVFLPPVAHFRSAGTILDVNNDGAIDLALGNSLGLVVLTNNGAGDFTVNPQTFAVGSVQSVNAADFIGDGRADLCVVRAGPTPMAAVLLENRGALGLVSVPTSGLTLAARAGAAGQIDGTGYVDLIVAATDGTVSVARNLGGGGFVAGAVLPQGVERTAVALGDLDQDGDFDALVGASNGADALLLNDAGRLLDTDRPLLNAPATAFAVAGLSVVVDANADGDPDLLAYTFDGRPTVCENLAGVELNANPLAVVPRLPTGNAIVALQPVAITGPRPADVVAVGVPSASSPDGVFVLAARPGGGFVDATASYWPQPRAAFYVAVTVGAFGANPTAANSLVLLDAATTLTLQRLTPTGYVEVVGAFPPGGGPFGGHRLAVGDVDRDGLADVAVIGSNGGRLYQGLANGTFASARAVGMPNTTRGGQLADLDGDGNLDFALALGAGGVMLLAGNGGGGFTDVTVALLPAPGNLDVRDLVLVDRDLVVATADDRYFVFPWAGNAFAAGQELRLRGAAALFQGFLVADLDVDGDRDLVVLRNGVAPSVLLQQTTQLNALGVVETGRSLALDIHGDAQDLAFVLMSPLVARAQVPSFGVLRLAAPATVLTTPLPGGTARIVLPIPGNLSPTLLPLQLVTYRAVTTTLRLRNLIVPAISSY